MKKSSLLLAAVVLFAAAGCTSNIEKAIENNPDIVFNAIKKNPKRFVEVVNEAVRSAQEAGREDEAKEEAARLEEEFKNPKKPEINDERTVFGPKDAPITIVEYSDFQCPYCSKGYATLKEVEKMYGDKVRVIFKHLPLDFHPMAMPAAKWFEAIAKQDRKKAAKFHDYVFEIKKILTKAARSS